MIIRIIVVLNLMYYFPFITCVHGREKKDELVWNSIIYAYTSRMCQNNKHTHIYARLLLCFSFSTKKTPRSKKRAMCRRRYCLLLLLGRARERTDGVGETTKRKAWSTSSGNREEKVCVYVAAIGWGKKRRRKRTMAVRRRVQIEDLLSFPSDEKQKKSKKKERRKKESQCTSNPSPDQSVSSDDAMLMNNSIVDDNFLCFPLALSFYRQRPTSLSLPLLFAFF